MGRFIEGSDRREQLFLPPCVDDFVAEDSVVRVVDLFVDELELAALGFSDAAATGRPGYHPGTMLKLYVYGYLNQVQSSRRLEREAGRNVEVTWLTGKLASDFKTIADFRRDQGAAIQAVCRRFVLLCRELGLIAGGAMAVDGSRFRAVNARDRNFTPVTIRRRMEQVDASITRYLSMLDTADRQDGEAGELRTVRFTTRLDELRRQMRELEAMEQAVRGTVRNSVCGRAVEHYAAMALMKRSPQITANWALAMDHSRGGLVARPSPGWSVLPHSTLFPTGSRSGRAAW